MHLSEIKMKWKKFFFGGMWKEPEREWNLETNLIGNEKLSKNLCHKWIYERDDDFFIMIEVVCILVNKVD